VINFTTISATKGLLKDLRKKGVKITRESTPRAGEYVPGYESIHKVGLGGMGGIGGPNVTSAVLWHEAGHHVAKTGDFNNDKSSMDKLVKDVSLLPLEDQMKAGIKHQADTTIRKEVNANRGAIKMMRQKEVPESRVSDFKVKARKQIGGYEDGFSKGKMRWI